VIYRKCFLLTSPSITLAGKLKIHSDKNNQMKKTLLIIAANIILVSTSQAQFGNILNKAEDAASSAVGGSGGGITQGDAASAIKEALSNGIKKGVTQVSATDGYFANAAIKVLMPPEAKKVEDGLRSIGQGALVDKVILQMNRSAEQAAPKATQIFLDAISHLSISDALNLVQSKQQDACTQFLKKATTDALIGAFKPSIKTALDATHTNEAWSDLMNTYNQIPFVSRVNTDLPDFVTRKAIDGLFYTIAQEEAKIRKDPMGQASALIKKVFGSVLGK
jgi:hypothetical protein